MRKKTLGYIVVHDFLGPLDFCRWPNYPHRILLRADTATVFETPEAANEAISNTLEWARREEQEGGLIGVLDWAEEGKYSVRRLCPAGAM